MKAFEDRFILFFCIIVLLVCGYSISFFVNDGFKEFLSVLSNLTTILAFFFAVYLYINWRNQEADKKQLDVVLEIQVELRKLSDVFSDFLGIGYLPNDGYGIDFVRVGICDKSERLTNEARMILDKLESLCRQFHAYERKHEAISNQVPKSFLRSPIDGDKLIKHKHFIDYSHRFVFLFEDDNFLIGTRNGLYSTQYKKILSYEISVKRNITSFGEFSLMLDDEISAICDELRELTYPVQ